MRVSVQLTTVAFLLACRTDKGPDAPDPGDSDDPSDCPEWHADADADGYGDASVPAVADCVQPEGHVDNALDCDDTDPMVNPDGSEICDEADVDEDCSGLADDADPDAAGQTEAWPDADGDGSGDPSGAPSAFCDPPDGWATVADDCDDANPAAYPGAAYVEDAVACMVDADGDGWGAPAPTGDAVAGTDCDDTSATVAPDATELFGDDLDQDCDGEDLWILEDDFELGAADPSVFASVSGEVAFDDLTVHAGLWSASLGAAGSTMRTVTLDATSCDGLLWSYFGKRGPEQPDAGEFLKVQYLDGATWIDADLWEGNGSEDLTFAERTGLILAPAALNPNAAVRLLATGGSTNFDHFLVDDFLLMCGGADADADGVPERLDCDETDDAHWSDCGSCTDADGDDHGLGCDLGDDCDDADPAILPGALDPQDGVDQDCDTIDGPWLADTFELGAPDPDVWASLTGAVKTSTSYVANGDYAMELESSAGEAVTATIDTTSCPEVVWSYAGKRGPDTPDVGEDLVLWYDGGSGWVVVDTWAGEGVLDAAYSTRSGTLADAGALSSTFRMRFTWDNSSTTESFYVDDLVFGCPSDADGDGLIDCDDTSAAHQTDCDTCVDLDGDDYGEACDLGGDCDDADPTIAPNQPDPVGDGIDADCTGLDGPSLFDDFEGGLAPGLWHTVDSNVTVSSTAAASGTSSLKLEDDGSIITTPIDVSSCAGLYWSYQGKRGPDAPDTGSFLDLEVWTGSTWLLVDSWAGTGAVDAAFAERSGLVPSADALHSAFQLRLTSRGALADDWFVDDLMVECGEDSDADLAIDPIDCAPSDPLHWFDCGLCVDGDGDGWGTDCDLGPDCDDGDPNTNPDVLDLEGDGVDRDCDTVDGDGIVDDFELGGPSPYVWETVSGSVKASTSYVGAGTTSAALYGDDGVLESFPLDTSTCTSVVWSYLGKRGGEEQPDSGDFLELQFFDGVDWLLVDAWEGGATDATFSKRSGTITDRAAFHPDFRIRFVSLGDTGDYDFFYIDEVLAVCGGADADGDGVNAALDCDDAAPLHWDDCGACIDGDGDGYGIDCDLGEDCDDGDAGVRPGVADPAGDGVDQDCNHFDGGKLFDDFDTGALKPSVWSTQFGDVAVSTDERVSGSYSLELDGDGFVETLSEDTSPCTDLVWFYQGKRGSGSSFPETADLLNVSWWDGAAWVVADTWAGAGSADPAFALRWGYLTDPAAFAAGFRARVESVASLAGSDAFYVDDFGVGCTEPDTDGDGLPSALDCDPNDGAHWTDCDRCQDLDGDGYGLDCNMGADCDDGNPAINPRASDTALDGVDQNCDRADGPALYDGFELGVPSPAVWSVVTGGAAVGSEHVANGMYGLTFDGDGSVESVALSTVACTTVVWTYQGKRGPQAPDAVDSLTASWFDGAVWRTEDVWNGDSSSDAAFALRWGVIDDPAAKFAGFRFRLVSDGTTGSDDFQVDDVAIGCSLPDLDGDGVPGGIDCDDGSALHWADCGQCTDDDLDGYGAGCDLGADCDDSDATVNPGETDVLGDGLDVDCTNLDGPGLFDDFEAGYLPALWSLQSDATYSTAFAWSGTTSLELGPNGLAETSAVDLSTCSAVFWSFRGLRDGADADETLTVSWDDGAAWVPADTWAGNGGVDADFDLRWGVITDPAALWPGLRLQLLADASIEDWYVDDLTVDCDVGDGDGDGVPANIDCDDADAWHWFDCGACVDADLDGYGAGCDLGSDCDDADGFVHPAATDPALDGLDEDCDLLDLAVLEDDFETGVSTVFTSLTGDLAAIEDSGIGCPSNPAGCGMTLRLGGDSIATSVAWDSTACTTIGWAYEGRRGPDAPESSDTLTLQWNAGLGWISADTWAGVSGGDPTFLTRSGTIVDPAAFSATLQLRLVSDGTAAFDDWFVDDIRFGCAD